MIKVFNEKDLAKDSIEKNILNNTDNIMLFTKKHKRSIIVSI